MPKNMWQSSYNFVFELLRRLTPQPIKNIRLNVLFRLEKKTILENQKILQRILQEKPGGEDYRAIIVFPPSLDWNVQLFQRPQQLALALAKQGALVFYIEPKPDHKQQQFKQFRERLYLCPVHVGTFDQLTNSLIYLLTWNRKFASQFTRPRILYDYVDDINAFLENQRKYVEDHQYLLKNANFILATAQKLVEEVRLQRPDVIFSPNGVDYDHFSRAARREFPSPPNDMSEILSKAKPIIGYYGALAQWFDYDLLKSLASLRPDYQFVLIGSDHDGSVILSGIEQCQNIYWLGLKAYQELPQYLQYFDVTTIPFIVNEITNSASPLKLFEYMAGEKPIVVTPMKESMQYPGVLVGEGAHQFAQKLDQALQMRRDQKYLSLLRQTAKQNTWEQRAEDILSKIEYIH